MKNKLFLFLVAALVLVSGLAYAGTGVLSSENVRIIRSPAGGNTPFCDAILVNVGSEDAVAVGDVLVWNSDVNDGFAVLKARHNSDTVTSTNPMPLFAGVALEVTSADVSTANANSTKQNSTSTLYMAIKGFCQAKIDSSAAVKGHPLVIRGGDLTSSFGTMSISLTSMISTDIGVLLDEDGGIDGVYNVWLN